MKRNYLGSTGLQLSRLGLGTVKLGRNQQVKYPQGFTLPSDREATDLLDLAWDLGINLLDTAPAYGTSELRLGQLLRRQSPAKDWLIATKVGEEFDGETSSFNFSPEHVEFSVQRSLQRLQRESLDIVLVHSDGNDEAILSLGTLDKLADMKQRGLIRAYGMSSKTVAGGLAALAKSDLAMVTYNLRETAEEEVINRARADHKGILIKKALASGHLCHSGESGENADPVKEGLQFVFSHPGVTSAIIGTITPAHLRHNIDIVNQLD